MSASISRLGNFSFKEGLQLIDVHKSSKVRSLHSQLPCTLIWKQRILAYKLQHLPMEEMLCPQYVFLLHIVSEANPTAQLHKNSSQREGGRVVFSRLFSKLDLPLFRGPFLSILHHNKARVGGWDLNSTQSYFLSKYSIYQYFCNIMSCMLWNGLSI